MPDHDLLIELFPIETQRAPRLTAYAVAFEDEAAAQRAGKPLARRLTRSFSGRWVWSNFRLLTDTPASAAQLAISLDVMRHDAPDLYGTLQDITEDNAWSLSPQALADFVADGVLRPLRREMKNVLSDKGARLQNGYVLREPRVGVWTVGSQPTLSLSIRSHLLHDRNLQQVMTTLDTPDDALGTPVLDRTPRMVTGVVDSIIGTMRDERERLIQQTNSDALQKYLRGLPDDEYVVQVITDNGTDTDEYPASALRVVIPVDDPAAFTRYEVLPAQAAQALALPSDERVRLVTEVSKVLKHKGIIGNAYNSRTDPAYFAALDTLPEMEFANGRVRPFEPQRIARNFLDYGIYRMADRFADAPIRMALINTLDDPLVGDFVEAMRRQIERDVEASFEVIRERNVRVVSEANIASAVRAVDKEDPDIVLAFFPDEADGGDYLAEYLTSLTLSKGIASHAVYERTMHDPDAMPAVVMGLLAKTGNAPYVLAEPLDYADVVVGLDVVRESLSWGDRVVAMTRIYRADGSFREYRMHDIELDTGEAVPFVVFQTLFPEEIFGGRRILVHHDGVLPDDIVHKLQRWATVLDATMYPVEILRDVAPHFYALTDPIRTADWGSVFRLNDDAMFAVTSLLPENNARPLLVRVPDSSLTIDHAVHSVLIWTLLHYTPHGHTLPVSIKRADDMAQWLARGMLPERTQGAIPFWL